MEIPRMRASVEALFNIGSIGEGIGLGFGGIFDSGHFDASGLLLFEPFVRFIGFGGPRKLLVIGRPGREVNSHGCLQASGVD